MWLDGWFGKRAPDPGTDDTASEDINTPSLSRGKDGRLHPSRMGGGGTQNLNTAPVLKTVGKGTPAMPDTSALNKQIVQAVQFSNAETTKYGPELVSTPPEMMVSTTTGLAVQDAKNYMNAIMQIAVAAQAVAIKKAAEGPEPVAALKEIPLLAEIQNMVTQAVGVYGNVSSTAGTSASTVINDLKSS
ncbi:hypothetical protein [Roseibium sp.]|uniref:hypothetical protein n=1 Tax=Roseibium sp. TaxID=1936156 RepID=UPI003A973FB3